VRRAHAAPNVRYFDADEGRLWDQVVLSHLQANCFDVDAALTVAEAVIHARRRTGR